MDNEPNLENIRELRVLEIDECNFPIVEKEVNGYKVLVLPEEIQQHFDEGGYDAVRINSAKLAATLPNYGGLTVEGHSVPTHQDHHPSDRRRFLTLSQTTPESRGASTFIITPEAAALMIPEMIRYFEEHKNEIRSSFKYNEKNQVPEELLLQCFEDGGIEKVIQIVAGDNLSESDKTFSYSGLLAYLFKGKHADNIVEILFEKYPHLFKSEDWSRPGVLIVDNRKVFHGRRGHNDKPLNRHWLIESEDGGE